jgi:centriolar protein POC1
MRLHCSVVTSVAFHPENQCVASGSADRTLKMWDIRSHLLIQHYPAHDDEITSISMHPVSACLCCYRRFCCMY